MKFFTIDWWRGVQSCEDHDPVLAFRAHLAKIRDRLPPDLVALQESISLHDSSVRELRFESELMQMVIRLDGSDGAGGARHFSLAYDGVRSFHSTADPEVGLPGPHGYGDLGYDEADVCEDGGLEHRLLFSSGIELRIVFAGFKLHWTDVR